MVNQAVGYAVQPPRALSLHVLQCMQELQAVATAASFHLCTLRVLAQDDRDAAGGDHAKLCDHHGDILSGHGIVLQVEQRQAGNLTPLRQVLRQDTLLGVCSSSVAGGVAAADAVAAMHM